MSKFEIVKRMKKKCFSVHQWLDELSDKNQFSVTNYQSIPCADKKTQYYKIRLKTDTTNFSTKNSIQISLRLFGKSHQTEQIPLEQTMENKQTFQENNLIDTFEIQTKKAIKFY